MLEQVLDWCEKYHVYAILDLHGAPGGQSALACDDGIDNRPHMFTEPESRERALLIWEEFAKRYHDRWIIGGYDLLNAAAVRTGLPETAAGAGEILRRCNSQNPKIRQEPYADPGGKRFLHGYGNF